ncbi:MAG: potassium channel family protein [Nitrospinales bacterium]
MLKALPTEIITMMRSRRGQRNFRVLMRFFLVLVVLIAIYTVMFHILMLREGHDHSWITGFYWTLTVMSTLGFGDITFHSDIGRIFSIVVLLSGTTFLFVLLPFTFIEFFYQPWMNAQASARAPRKLPQETRGHVLLTNHDAVTSAIIRRLKHYNYQYALLVPEVEDALRLHDLGLNVVVGNLDDPKTWMHTRVESAALLACTNSDATNTNVAFTVRGLSKDLPIITSANDEAAVDILKLAGSNHVLRLAEMIGQSFARRTLGGDAMAHVIGTFDELMIAEATTYRTPLVGKTLRESKIRENLGVRVAGVW